MDRSPTAAWGKLRRDDRGHVVSWHPLRDHCADVAAVCECLLRDDVIRRRLARLAGEQDLSRVQIARLCFLAVLHDAGKANHGFRRKADANARDVEGHVGPVFEALCSDEPGLAKRLREALRCDLVERWAAQYLLFAALAHHGWPVKVGDAGRKARPALWNPAAGVDPLAEIGELAASALAWFPDACELGEPFPDAAEFSHAFAGIVTWADWIASDESLFPFSEPGDPPRIEGARTLAAKALERTGIDTTRAAASIGPDFAWPRAYPQHTPRPAQQAIVELPGMSDGSLVVLEAETGSGKTEAAVAHFLALLGRGEVDGLYFALPTRTAATQLHDRIHKTIGETLPEGARPPVILAVPGYLKVDDASGVAREPRLAPFRALWPDGTGEATRWRAWAAESSKRYLAGAISVGTIDQVLMSALAVKHAHLRASALLRQLLVVDEIHASDGYMNRLLEVVLQRHLKAGGHALLMSATLGGATRERLLTGRRRPPPLDECLAVPFPSVRFIEQGRGGEVRSQPLVRSSGAEPREKRVNVDVAGIGVEPAAVAGKAVEAARAGARVVIIRNRVADAVATQAALEAILGEERSGLLFRCAGRPAPHHSRFTREDRRRLDHDLEGAYGKARGSGGMVVVATQTVQQSLDLDADLLVSDLCPMDVLLQRVGRLHRHAGRDRPLGFEQPRVLVVTPPDRDLGRFLGRRGSVPGRLGLGTVYEDLRVVEATWRMLEQAGGTLVLPAMNRELVERTTHPEALREIVEKLGDSWVRHAQECDGKGVAKSQQAALVAFDWSEPYGTRGFDPAIEAIAATRLGANDRMAVFDEPFLTPFDEKSTGIAVPAWLVRGLPEDASPAVEGAVSGGGIRFRLGSTSLVYDRLGLRKADEPAAPCEEEANHG